MRITDHEYHSLVVVNGFASSGLDLLECLVVHFNLRGVSEEGFNSGLDLGSPLLVDLQALQVLIDLLESGEPEELSGDVLVRETPC